MVDIKNSNLESMTKKAKIDLILLPNFSYTRNVLTNYSRKT